jgi:hypothetical protein
MKQVWKQERQSSGHQLVSAVCSEDRHCVEWDLA